MCTHRSEKKKRLSNFQIQPAIQLDRNLRILLRNECLVSSKCFAPNGNRTVKTQQKMFVRRCDGVRPSVEFGKC